MQNNFELTRYLKEGWDLLMANFANLLVATLIFMAVQFAVGALVPFFGGIIVSGPLMGGMYYVILDLQRGEGFKPMRIFDGFMKKFVPLVLVGILTSVFITIGFVFLILPGLLIAGWYLFPYMYVVDKDMDFWPAMEASREIGFANHFNVFLMALVLVIANIVGAMMFGVGLLVSVPFSLCAVVIAYQHLTGAAAETAGTSMAPPPPPPPPPPA